MAIPMFWTVPSAHEGEEKEVVVYRLLLEREKRAHTYFFSLLPGSCPSFIYSRARRREKADSCSFSSLIVFRVSLSLLLLFTPL